MNELTMCGYICEQCKAFAPNIQRKDERKELSEIWKKYYDLDIPAEEIYCDGCRCDKPDAKRIDKECPVRYCVLEKSLQHCGECEQYPCETFNLRKGLCLEEAKRQQCENFSIDEYTDYLSAFDNRTRLDKYVNNKSS